MKIIRNIFLQLLAIVVLGLIIDALFGYYEWSEWWHGYVFGWMAFIISNTAPIFPKEYMIKFANPMNTDTFYVSNIINGVETPTICYHASSAYKFKCKKDCMVYAIQISKYRDTLKNHVLLIEEVKWGN